MKIFGNKKSMILILLLSIFTIFIFMPSLFVKIDSTKGFYSYKIGEVQLKILDIVDENEAKMFYIDQSAKYSAFLSMNELEKKGGYSSQSNCGQVNGYVLWQDEENDCFPGLDGAILSLQEVIGSYFDEYIGAYNLTSTNYAYFIKPEGKGFHLVGTAYENLISDIIVHGEQIGQHTIKPSFDVFVGYDINVYEELKDIFLGYNGLLENISACESNKELSDCIHENFEEFNLNNDLELSVDCDRKDRQEDRSFIICARRGESYIVPDSELGFLEMPQEIKFSLYFRKNYQVSIKPRVINPPGEDSYAILFWDKPGEGDYEIYYDKELFFDLNGTFISSETNTLLTEFSANCNYNEVNGKCMHPIGAGEESLDELRNIFVCNDNSCFFIADNVFGPYVYVNLVDNDIKGGKMTGEIIEIVLEDNLAPGKSIISYDSEVRVLLPDKNIDGSELNDNLVYYLFLKEGGCDGIITVDDNKEIDLTYRKNEEDINLIISSAESGKTFCLASLAADEDGNPVRLAENEELINVLKIKSEYVDVLTDLYSTALITTP